MKEERQCTFFLLPSVCQRGSNAASSAARECPGWVSGTRESASARAPPTFGAAAISFSEYAWTLAPEVVLKL